MAKATLGQRRFRSGFIVSLLLLTLLLAMILAGQAIATARYHQTSAEGVLRDYAKLAAGQFAARASQDLYYNRINPTLQELTRTANEPLPSPPDSVAGYFEITGDGVLMRGVDSSAALATWIGDTVRAHAPTLAQGAPFGGIVRENPAGSFLLIYPQSEGRVRGFLMRLADLAPLFRVAAIRGPLLPPSLTEGVATDSLVSVRVTSPEGADIFRTEPQYPETFAAWDSLGDYVGLLPVHAALRPDIAQGLIIGGLPRSRLPILIGLLGLTAGLIVAALLLLRREHELARLRAEFVSGVSHELRTPLAQIRMFSETLRLGRVRSDEEQERSLRIVDQEARRLTHLVENLLYFSRSERQPPHITPSQVALGNLVHEVVDAFEPLAAARSMTVEVSPHAELTAVIDPDAVRQIILNLLENAAKYGPPGQSIFVEVSAPNGRARLVVEDQGPGIPPADRARVWERFWRLERDRHSHVPGTGIGLAIVRELAELHGGSVAIEDGIRGGARFVVILGRVTAGGTT